MTSHSNNDSIKITNRLSVIIEKFYHTVRANLTPDIIYNQFFRCMNQNSEVNDVKVSIH